MELDVRIGCLLALCDLAKHKSHLLWLPATGEYFLLPVKRVEAQVSNNNFDYDKEKSPGFLPMSLGRRETSCTQVRGDNISCSTLTT